MGDFFFQFLFILIGNSAFFEFLPVFFRFRILGNLVAEAVVDALYFLTEVVIALLLFHTAPHFPVYFRLQAADLYFFIKKPANKNKPFHNVVFFQNSLPSCRAYRHLCRNEISGVSRRVGSFQLLHLLIRKILLGIVNPFKEGFQKGPSVCFPTKRVRRLDFRHILHLGHQAVFFSQDAVDTNAGNPFRLYADEAAGQLKHLFYFYNGAKGVEIFFLRYFHFSITLHDHSKIPVAAACGADGFNRFFSPDIQVHCHMGKNNDIAKSHNRQCQNGCISYICILVHKNSSYLIIQCLCKESTLLYILPHSR